MGKLIFSTIFVLVLAGCATSKSRIAQSSSNPSHNTAKKQTEEAALASVLKNVNKSKTDYKINSADLLEITVYREEDLTRTARISQNGTISFPLVGIIHLGGKSTTEAGQALAKKLGEYLVNPQVTIFVKEYGNKQIYVLGEVKNPGSFELPTETQLTVLEAISKAGGFSPIAAKDRTKVIRTNDDGKNESLIIDVSAITTKGEKHKDIALKPNDVIYIPQSFF